MLPRSAISARAYFSTEAALEAKKNKQKVCLFKNRFGPPDTIIMRELDAVVCGEPAAIHVVTICQGYGIPALVNTFKQNIYFSKTAEGKRCTINQKGIEIKEGDWVTISSRQKCIYKGLAKYQPSNLVRDMAVENPNLVSKEQKKVADLARVYQAYKALVSNIELSKIKGLQDLIKLVRYEFKAELDTREKMVNAWFDCNPAVYLDEVLSCEMGAHHNQQTIYHLLSIDRQIMFFIQAIDKCINENRSGFMAGCFTLGRFISIQHPVRFWEALSPTQVAFLLNEWLKFEKYINVLTTVGEQKIMKAQKTLSSQLTDPLTLSPARLKAFVTLKLSTIDLKTLPTISLSDSDPQLGNIIELLNLPLSDYYQIDSPWSMGQLRKICQEENIPMPELTA